MVIPSNEYDSLVSGTDALQVDAVEISSSTTAADNVEANIGNLDASVATVDTVVDAILADTGTDGVAISASTANDLADALLKRDWTSVSGEAARSALNALRQLRNKWSISGSTLTVTEEDDLTTAWTATVTTNSGADPVTAVDPA